MKKKNEFKVGQVYKAGDGHLITILGVTSMDIIYLVDVGGGAQSSRPIGSYFARGLILVKDVGEEKEDVSLLEISKPVAQYIKDNYPPHTKIVIGFEGIEVLKQERFFINPLR